MMATSPQRYMKRPTYVEVMLVAPKTIKDAAEWITGSIIDDPFHGKCVAIPKAKAPFHRAYMGQYIVRYANGNISVSDGDGFEETYIPAP